MFWLILIIVLAAFGFFLFSPMLKGWRTQIAATTVTVGGGVVPYAADAFGYLNAFDWRSYLDMRYVPAVMIGVGVTFAILRKMTTTAVGQK